MAEWVKVLDSCAELGPFMGFAMDMDGHVTNELKMVDGTPQVTVWMRETGDSMQKKSSGKV